MIFENEGSISECDPELKKIYNDFCNYLGNEDWKPFGPEPFACVLYKKMKKEIERLEDEVISLQEEMEVCGDWE